MRYIGRFEDKNAMQRFKKSFDGEILDEFVYLKMLTFELDGENSIYSKEDLEDIRGVIYIKEDMVVKLDDKTPSNIKSLSKNKPSNLTSTYVGKINNKEEYASHLEILNSRKYNQTTDPHDFATTSTGKNVDCFILDTGINSNNAFLKNKVFKTNFSDIVNIEGMDQEDNDGHGTSCALMLAGDEYGVALDANLYSLKVLDSEGVGSFSTIVAAINNVMEFHSNKSTTNPSIINMSLGYVPSPESPTIKSDFTKSFHDNPFKDAVKEAVTTGIHVVLAAGNGFTSEDVFYGPMYSEYTNGSLNLSPEQSGNTDAGQGVPIIVGSTDSASTLLSANPNQMSSFSNYGRGNTINSTGGELILPSWNVTQNDIDEADGGYSIDEENGTSFSAPLVSGLLALHLEKNPNASPVEARQWLIEVATSNEIDNLLKYKSFTSSFNVTWDASARTLKYETTENSLNFSEDFSENDVVQIKFDSNENIDTLRNYIAEINLINEDWWVINSVTEQHLKVSPFTNGSNFDYSTESFFESFEGELNVANLENTHESTDGVKLWQRMSEENRLFDENTNLSVYLGALAETNNLRAFNPYQVYTPDWGTTNTLDLNTIISNSPLLNAKLVTTRNEQPFEPKFEVVAGDLPTGVILNEDGTFSKTIDFKLESKEYGAIIIRMSTPYDSYVKMYEVTNSAVVSMKTDNLEKSGMVFAGSECDQTTNMVLDTKSDFISEVIRIVENKCEVWRNDMPANLVPFDTIEAGNIYYVKLAEGKSGKLDDVFRDNQNMLIIEC